MKKLNLTKITKKANLLGLKVSKNAPLLLTVAGVVGLGATAWFSYKSRDRISEIVDELEVANDQIETENNLIAEYDKYAKAGIEVPEHIVTDLQEIRETPVHLYTNKLVVAKDLAGAVALPVATGVASIACILFSYRILNNRNNVLATALGTAMAEHRLYRERVKSVAGEEAYKKIEQPWDTEKVKVKDENGKKKELDLDNPIDRRSMTGEWFFNSDQYTSDDHSYNMAFINSVKEKLELKLFKRGWLRLNEVYDAFGFARTLNGELMGWTSGGLGIDTMVCRPGLDENGNFEMPEIYVQWGEPVYIYDKIEYEGRYGE